MPSQVTWHGADIEKLVSADVGRKFKTIALALAADVKLKLRVPGPTKTNPGTASSNAGEPPHKRTGRLWRSISQEAVNEAGEPVARVGTNVDYGYFLEVGTSGHTIKPGAKGFLAWKNAAGKWVFTRKPVVIPPLAPRPYLRPALDEAGPKIDKILGRPIR